MLYTFVNCVKHFCISIENIDSCNAWIVFFHFTFIRSALFSLTSSLRASSSSIFFTILIFHLSFKSWRSVLFYFFFFRDYWQQTFLFEKWLLIFISHLIIFNSFDIKVYRVSGFCDITLLLYHFVRKIITPANGCLSEARQARLRFPIIRIIYPYACISELRDLSQTKWLATANYKRAGHLFDELPFLSDDATCHYPVVVK